MFTRDKKGFEEVNIYYYITTQRDYIGNLGFSPKWRGQDYIRFDARGTTAFNAYYYSEWDGQYLIFGVPKKYVDWGEDQDFIIHEYTHALHDALMSGWVSVNTDEQLISEGSGDYMAISYRKTLSSFQPNKFSPWVGNGEHDEFSGRFLSTSYSYPSSWTYPNYGILWASTLMDLQNYSDMGRDVTTRLLLKSYSYASPSTIVPDHVYFMMKADQSLYGENHLESIGQAFENRGFFNARSGSGAHSSNYLNGNITSNTTWSGIKWVNGNIYIKPGVSVTSRAFLFIGEFKKIFVENNATLTIFGSLTEYTGADIIVMPGGALYFAKRAHDQETAVSKLPKEYALLGNYPNPFNPTTTIKYSCPKVSSVDLKIYDLAGREIRALSIISQQSGEHEIKWDGKNEFGEPVSSGVYIYRIQFKTPHGTKIFEKAAKMVLTK